MTGTLLADLRDMGPSDEFLARMSHEMRTPLSAILGLCEIVLEGELEPAQRELLQRVHYNGEALLGLVQGLLDAARIEAGEVLLEEDPFDLRAVVERAVLGLGAATGPGVRLTCRVDSMLPDRLIGDAARVRQVLVNLIGNALKFTDSGEVRVQAIVHDSTPSTCWLELHVSDTGCGIAPGDVERIFDRFEQVGDGASKGGSGLGLSIARSFVDTMGGHIDVDSTLGEGTAFRVWLQLAVAEERCADRAQRLDVVRGARVHASGLEPAEQAIFEDLGIEVVHWTGPEPCIFLDEDGAECSRNLTLPLVESRIVDAVLELHGAVVAQEAAAQAATSLKILVVEDNADNAEVARRALARMGEVTLCENGLLALEAMQRQDFDCVLLDLHMPVLDGFETLRRIRARELRAGGRRVPVLAFSAHATEEVQSRCKALGVTAFLAKPAGAARIREAVDELVDPRPVVLVADDAPSARHIARHYLEGEGYRVIEAENGLRALYALRERRVDLVVADWEMPVLDGVDMAQRLRGDHRYERLPLIALTGHAGEVARTECLEAGFDTVLTKPVRKGALVEASRALLARKTQDAEIVEVDPDLSDLVPGYLADRRSDLGQMRAAVGSQDTDRLRRMGHSLKGTGGAYGFDQLTELGAELEAAGRLGDLDGASTAIDRIDDYLRRVRVRYAS